jgi:hypothetical protein
MACELLLLLSHILTKEEASNAFGANSKYVNFLITCLTRSGDVPFYAAQCLLVLTEENGNLNCSSKSSLMNCALKCVSNKQHTLQMRVLLAGVLYNIEPTLDNVQNIFPHLMECFTIYPQIEAMAVFQEMRREPAIDLDSFNKAKRHWTEITKSLTVCFELLANLVCATVKEDEDDSNDMDDDEDVLDEAKLIAKQEEQFCQSAIGGFLIQNGLLELVCDKVIEIYDFNAMLKTVLNNDIDMESSYDAYQTALLALFTNVLLYTPSFHIQRKQAVWNALIDVLVAKCAAAKSSLAEQQWCTIQGPLLVRGLCLLLNKDNHQLPIQQQRGIELSAQQFTLLFTACNDVASIENLEHLVGGAVDLLSLASLRLSDATENMVVGQWLIRLLHTHKSIVVTAAVVNGLMDIYSSETYDTNGIQMNLVSALKECNANLNDRVALYLTDPLHDDQVAAKLEMICDNLPSFIQYKIDHGCC